MSDIRFKKNCLNKSEFCPLQVKMAKILEMTGTTLSYSIPYLSLSEFDRSGKIRVFHLSQYMNIQYVYGQMGHNF